MLMTTTYLFSKVFSCVTLGSYFLSFINFLVLLKSNFFGVFLSVVRSGLILRSVALWVYWPLGLNGFSSIFFNRFSNTGFSNLEHKKVDFVWLPFLRNGTLDFLDFTGLLLHGFTFFLSDFCKFVNKSDYKLDRIRLEYKVTTWVFTLLILFTFSLIFNFGWLLLGNSSFGIEGSFTFLVVDTV